jgi:pyruvate kinase
MSALAAETRTKIVCTIGPASRGEDVLRAMIRSGMDVARINFSHGTKDEHGEEIESIRRIAREEDATIAILADLQGPKLRIGELRRPLDVKKGDFICLTSLPADGTDNVIPLPHPGLIGSAKVGGRLLFDDGLIEAVVRESRPDVLIAEVVLGGRLSSHKGISAPGGAGEIEPLTDKDREDARYAVSCGVDYIALSFVREAGDIDSLRRFLAGIGGGSGVGLIAKIEKREAIENIDEIIDASDAVMVARGDLGVELSPQEVPFHQKEIIRRCNRVGIPVITATQMLQSMISSPRPTRAEASDVANAILDGTDAVMLADEFENRLLPGVAQSRVAPHDDFVTP